MTEVRIPHHLATLRADNLDEVIAAMTLEEKTAQLVGLWLVAADGARRWRRCSTSTSARYPTWTRSSRTGSAS